MAISGRGSQGGRQVGVGGAALGILPGDQDLELSIT